MAACNYVGKEKIPSKDLLYNNFICWSPIKSSIVKLLIDVDLRVEKSTQCCHATFSMLFAFSFSFSFLIIICIC